MSKVYYIVAIAYCRPNPDGQTGEFKLVTGYSLAGSREWALANTRQKRLGETIGAGFVEVCAGTKTIDKGIWAILLDYFWEVVCYHHWRMLRMIRRP